MGVTVVPNTKAVLLTKNALPGRTAADSLFCKWIKIGREHVLNGSGDGGCTVL